jgi:hypothetical protein
MFNGPFAIITTIQPPTSCARHFAGLFSSLEVPLLIIGDSKGPFEYDLPGTELWSLDRQQSLNFGLQALLPVKHYSRKNLGYLIAIERGAGLIYETDDDNAPLCGWTLRTLMAKAITLETQHWSNVYRWFTDDLIWPRGFPLEAISDERTFPKVSAANNQTEKYAPIQQGLANNSPDVDAVWRLVLDKSFDFKKAPSILLPAGTWCPFNSQTTWWWPDTFPLLYLPSYCSFRMTDIWRSFIAQRCLWELGSGVVFHAPEVYQERNQHSLLRDFEAEVPGYLCNANIVNTLGGLSLRPGVKNVSDNLIRCYEALIAVGVVPQDELPLVIAWCDDLNTAIRLYAADGSAAQMAVQRERSE